MKKKYLSLELGVFELPNSNTLNSNTLNFWEVFEFRVRSV